MGGPERGQTPSGHVVAFDRASAMLHHFLYRVFGSGVCNTSKYSPIGRHIYRINKNSPTRKLRIAAVLADTQHARLAVRIVAVKTQKTTSSVSANHAAHVVGDAIVAASTAKLAGP